MIRTIGMAFLLAALGVTQVHAQGGPASYRWTGFYAGLHVGYGSLETDGSLHARDALGTTLLDTLASSSPATHLSADADGWVAGGQLGWNHRLSNFVWGFEADLSRADMDGTASRSGMFGLFNITHQTRSELDWLGTVRLRAGVLLHDRALLYATGGLAYGRVAHSWNTTAPGFVTAQMAGAKTEWAAGWTIGAGLELALTSRITLRGEYLYYDLADTRYDVTRPLPFPVVVGMDSDNTGHVGRAALNFRF